MDAECPRGMGKRADLARLLAAAAAIVLFALLARSSFDEILNEIRQTSPVILRQCLMLWLIGEALRNVSYSTSAAYLHARMPWHRSLYCSLVCAAVSFVTMGAGTFLFMYRYYRKCGIREADTTVIQLFQFLMGRSASLCLSLAVVSICPSLLPDRLSALLFVLAIVIDLALCVGCIAFCLSAPLHRLICRIVQQLFRRSRWKAQADWFVEEMAALRSGFSGMLQGRFLLGQALLAMAVSILPCAIPALLHAGELPFGEAAGMMVLTNLIAGILFLPGSLGAVLLSYLLLFAPSFGKVHAMSALLIYRFFTFALLLSCSHVQRCAEKYGGALIVWSREKKGHKI